MADVDILIKLFDTLKESNKETSDLCHALLQNQNDISNYIKNLPMEEVKQLLKDHAKESSDEIDSCTETVEEKTDGVIEEVKKIDTKISKMILVVIVAFSLMSLAILIGGISYKYWGSESDSSHAELIKTIEEQQIIEHDLLIDAIREEIRKEIKDQKKK